MLKIGLFGGTFDPPHLGHLILGAEAQDQLQLDSLFWVLTPDPPHKQGLAISLLKQRLALIQAAIEDNPNFQLSRVDIERPGPQYALDTVNIFRREYPGAEIYYLIGGDSLHDLPTWHAPADLIRAVTAFGVMRRPGDEVDLTSLEEKLPGLVEKTRFVDTPLLEISSSQIRKRIQAGRPFRYYLPEKVYRMIIEQGLYRG